MLAIITIIGITIFWGGFAASVLWGWFATPLGAPPISALHAAGLGTMLSAFLGSRGVNLHRESKEGDVGIALMAAILFPALSLATGWVIRFLMS